MWNFNDHKQQKEISRVQHKYYKHQQELENQVSVDKITFKKKKGNSGKGFSITFCNCLLIFSGIFFSLGFFSLNVFLIFNLLFSCHPMYHSIFMYYISALYLFNKIQVICDTFSNDN